MVAFPSISFTTRTGRADARAPPAVTVTRIGPRATALVGTD
jgi:hypothetical protein